MKRPRFEGRFFETYHFANIVRKILHDQFSYLSLLEEFFCDEQHLAYVAPFRRYSAFHSFIEFIIDGLTHEGISESDLDERKKTLAGFADDPDALCDLRPARLPIEEAFEYY